jgi:CRP-like cAMP-binding protein
MSQSVNSHSNQNPANLMGTGHPSDGSAPAASASTGTPGAHNPALEALFCHPNLGGRQLNYPAGTVLCEPDHPATDVFFVHRGQVRLHQLGADGSSLLLEILGPGQWFGVSAIAGRETCGVRATAVVPSSVTKVAAVNLLQHVCSSPEGARELIRELAAQHCEAYDDAARLVFDDCNTRLVKTLLHFSHTAAATKRDHNEGGGVVLRITHQQLAQAVGVARETVSLALTQLRKQNVLKTGRNQLFFDPEVLKNFHSSHAKPPAAANTRS